MIPFLVGLGVLILAASLAFAWPRTGFAALAFLLALLWHLAVTREFLASPFQTAMLFASGLVGLGRTYAWRPRLSPLVRSLYAAALLVALVGLHYLGRVAEGLPLWILAIHVGSFLVAYSALTLAFLSALFGYRQHVVLKKAPWAANRRPPLVVLMGLEEPYLRAGYLAYTLGLFTGMAWAFRVWGAALSWDPKEVATLVAWGFFTVRLLLPSSVSPGLRLFVFALAFLAMAMAFFAAPLFGGRHPV